jgi:hypothetical protein
MQVVIYYTTLIRGEFGHEEYDTNIMFNVNAENETDAKKKAIKRLKTMEDKKEVFIFKINKMEVKE